MCGERATVAHGPSTARCMSAAGRPGTKSFDRGWHYRFKVMSRDSAGARRAGSRTESLSRGSTGARVRTATQTMFNRPHAAFCWHGGTWKTIKKPFGRSKHTPRAVVCDCGTLQSQLARIRRTCRPIHSGVALSAFAHALASTEARVASTH